MCCAPSSKYDCPPLQVGLSQLLERCSEANEGHPWSMVADWASMLSLGEQQRLAIARVLIARPSLVLLDEATSALDAANEARLYGALMKRGLTLVSVGHRESLRQYHDTLLTLEGGESGAWSLQCLSHVDDSPLSQLASKPASEGSRNV
jgi:ABC-type uncharacterized transport system fused permease/ATPase subunit